MSDKKCPDCGGLPGLYPNNQCPVCYVKEQYAKAPNTDWLIDVLNNFFDAADQINERSDYGYTDVLEEAKQAIQQHEQQAIVAELKKVDPIASHQLAMTVSDRIEKLESALTIEQCNE